MNNKNKSFICIGAVHKDINLIIKKNYYLKICDQTEKKEQFILKIPNNYELPKYHFGDVFEVKKNGLLLSVIRKIN